MTGTPWRMSWRADPAARRLADDHYNRQHPGTPDFCGPARVLVLKTADRDPVTGRPWAVWVTQWPMYRRDEWAGTWVNTLFRREGGPVLASGLIGWAVAHTRAYWPVTPPAGIITFIDPGKIRSTNPGYCYQRAGWVKLPHRTAVNHLLIYQQVPGDMPAPATAPGMTGDLFGALT